MINVQMPLITRSHHFHWNMKKGQLTLAHLSEDFLSIASMKNLSNWEDRLQKLGQNYR